MKVLVTMKLADLNLKTHMLPLSGLDEVDKILIVRDTAGPVLDKVSYHCPPDWARKILPANVISKLLLSLHLALKERPDLILGYLFFPHGLMACLIGKLSGTRVGVNLIAGPVEFYGLGGPVNQVPYTKPLPALSRYGRIVCRILKTCDVIIVGGHFSKSFLERIDFDSEKIHVLCKPMDVTFCPTSEPKEIDVLYLGRLTKVKHIDTILRAISIVKRELPEIRVAIVGDGPEFSDLMQLSDSLGLSDSVTFHGWQNDPWRWINRSRISVLASEREGFPQSAMQSLFCGVPVVSSSCGDLCDMVISGYNGVVVQDYDDADSFASSIVSLLQNPAQLEVYSRNAIVCARDRCSLDAARSVWRAILEPSPV